MDRIQSPSSPASPSIFATLIQKLMALGTTIAVTISVIVGFGANSIRNDLREATERERRFTQQLAALAVQLESTQRDLATAKQRETDLAEVITKFEILLSSAPHGPTPQEFVALFELWKEFRAISRTAGFQAEAGKLDSAFRRVLDFYNSE